MKGKHEKAIRSYSRINLGTFELKSKRIQINKTIKEHVTAYTVLIK